LFQISRIFIEGYDFKHTSEHFFIRYSYTFHSVITVTSHLFNILKVISVHRPVYLFIFNSNQKAIQNGDPGNLLKFKQKFRCTVFWPPANTYTPLRPELQILCELTAKWPVTDSPAWISALKASRTKRLRCHRTCIQRSAWLFKGIIDEICWRIRGNHYTCL